MGGEGYLFVNYERKMEAELVVVEENKVIVTPAEVADNDAE